MMKAENKVGRLIEITFINPYTALELSHFFDALGTIIRVKRPMLTVLDFREYGVFTPSEELSLTELMRTDNKLVIQTGFMLNGANGRTQIDRMLGNAGSPNRRVFTSSGALSAWMEPALLPAELLRLKIFLAAGGYS